MGDAVGGTLGLAVGVAISPVPIIAIILMLATPRGRANGTLFAVGWLAGLAALGTVVLLVAGPADASGDTEPATWVGWLQLILGMVLLLAAVRQ